MGYRYDPCDICCDFKDCCTCSVQMSFVDIDLVGTHDGTFTLEHDGVVSGECQWSFENATSKYVLRECHPGELGIAIVQIFSMPGETLVCDATHSSTPGDEIPECMDTDTYDLPFVPDGCEESTTVSFDKWTECGIPPCGCPVAGDVPESVNVTSDSSCSSPPCTPFPSGFAVDLLHECLQGRDQYILRDDGNGGSYTGDACIFPNVWVPRLFVFRAGQQGIYQRSTPTTQDPFDEYTLNLISGGPPHLFDPTKWPATVTWTPI